MASRRRKIDRTATERIVGALKAGAGMGIAADVVDVSRQAIYAKMKRDRRFAERIDEAREYASEKVVRSLYKAAMRGHVTAQIFWLKNRLPNEWRDRHEIVGQVDIDVGERLLTARVAHRERRKAEASDE